MTWRRRLVLLAGLAALPALAVAGFFSYALTLPPIARDAIAERSTVVLDRDGHLLRAFVTADGRWKLPVTADTVDPRYLAMLQAFEDKRFERHHGIDPLAMLRAAGQLLKTGRIVSGGSTLTMQVARLIEPREERTLAAKLHQMARAVALERQFDKREILDLYLTLAPFGGNLEGVRAASLAYFGKEPRRLSTAEAALLVALPQSPETRRPDRYAERAKRARARVLARLAAGGLVTPSEAAQASDAALPTERRLFPIHAAHLAEDERRANPSEHRIRLTIDGRLQASLEQLARERGRSLDAKLSIAIVAIDNASGELRASVGGIDYFSDEKAGAVDLTRALRSPGSALKPFIYALAFDNGIAHPETMLEDRPARYGSYAPENFDLGFQGMVTARKALQNSLNVPAVELLAAVGPQRFLARLRDAGATIALPQEDAPGLAVGLGGLGITLGDLTRLYAGLARGGEMLPLTTRPSGAPAREAGRRFVEPVAAWYVADILLGAPPPQNGLPASLAYKTGTSYGYRDAWAVGFDRNLTIGVWVGRADNGATPGLVGRQVAAPILFDAFARAGLDPRPLPAPPGAIFATSSSLPPPLRHLRQDVPKTVAAIATPVLRLAFPPDGARVDLGGSAGQGGQSLSLKVTGGAPPFTWLVNGAPVKGPGARRAADWRPDGIGFARISVIDAHGASDSVSVRLE
jgi:penicillin-binding protein 1C